MSKFYICKICGNLVEKIEDSGLAPFCCGKKMTGLNAAENEGAGEKHIPVVSTTKLNCLEECNLPTTLVHVEIGSQPHPSLNNHFIKWIQLQTDQNIYRHVLNAGAPPSTNFIINSEEKILNVYCYCNIHGLWVTNTVK